MKYRSLTEKTKSYFLLTLILSISLAMRLWKLDFQSLWLDELHTMNEADPDIDWKSMLFYLKCCDQQPPLYFVLARISFEIFGHTAIAVRLISVFAGTVSIWAMFLLGKEILNRNLGLIAASLTAVNFYNLHYSQEARVYSLAFLFSIFSFLFLIRVLKKLTLNNSILYAVFTLLLLYSHYYGLFILSSQIVLIILFLFFTEKSKRQLYIRRFLLSGGIVAVGYFPWLPYLKAMSEIHSFWAPPVSIGFLRDYFFQYFGNASVLKHLLIVLLFGYLVKVFHTTRRPGVNPVESNPLWFSFIILSTWILVTVLIPFLRSIWVVPMLVPRYTIVILPAFLIVLAYAIELINYKSLKWIVFSLFMIFSLNNIIVVKKYYSVISKSQFREMTQFVVENNGENYPVINERVAWQQQYYFKAMNCTPTILHGSKLSNMDSILASKTSKYNVSGFWIIGAHGDSPLTSEQKKGLDTAFVMVKEKKLFDAWAELYVKKIGIQNPAIRKSH